MIGLSNFKVFESILLNKSFIEIKALLKDPFYKNSLYIYMNTIMSAGFGLIFFLIAARLYSAEYMGITSALISSAGIIVCLSGFGFQNSIIRFLPSHPNRISLISTSMFFSLFFTIFFSIIYIEGINFISPTLGFLNEPFAGILFMSFLLFQLSINFFNSCFVSLRLAKYSFLQNFFLGSRLVFVLFLTSFGILGIFSSVVIAYMTAFIIGLLLINKLGIAPRLIFEMHNIRDLWTFSFANYLSDSLSIAQTSILPIFILNTIGAKEAAYFSIAFSIANILYAIPGAIFTSMFVEGSHEEPLNVVILKSIKLNFLILIPAIFFLFFFGNYLLCLFGRDYSENAFAILKILAISSVFVAINSMVISIMKIHKDAIRLAIINLFIFILVVLFSYLLPSHIGLIGVALGWGLSQLISSISFVIIFKNNLIADKYNYRK